jgi:hypothetical protein
MKPNAWMAMHAGIPVQSTTDEPTAIHWRKAGGDVRELFTGQSVADALRYEMALDGFGCACTPQQQCRTCNARAVLQWTLDGFIKRMEGAV